MDFRLSRRAKSKQSPWNRQYESKSPYPPFSERSFFPTFQIKFAQSADLSTEMVSIFDDECVWENCVVLFEGRVCGFGESWRL